MKTFLIYDSRYHTDPDKASVFSICDNEEEAKKESTDYGDNNVIVQYDVEPWGELVNPKIIE